MAKQNRDKVQWATREHIIGEGAVKEFFSNCIHDLGIGLGFHPDTDFTDYVYGANSKKAGKRMFTDDEAVELNKTLAECFMQSVKGKFDIYKVALDIMQPLLEAKPGAEK